MLGPLEYIGQRALGLGFLCTIREIEDLAMQAHAKKNLFFGPLGPTRPPFRHCGVTKRTAGEANERARYGGYGLAARVGIKGKGLRVKGKG